MPGEDSANRGGGDASGSGRGPTRRHGSSRREGGFAAGDPTGAAERGGVCGIRRRDSNPAQLAEGATPDQITDDLTNPAVLRALLRKHGVLRTNKSLGQHLLISHAALMDVVDAAQLTPADAVIEVGSGTGVLTVELAQRAHRVVAVEIDRNILPVLHETTARFPNVEIVPRDLLDVDPAVVFGDQPYKLVANLPYYITALTLRHFLEADNPPRRLVVLVQREVAERIIAPAGDMSLLTLSVQFFGTPAWSPPSPPAPSIPRPR